ncbi:NADPH2:quinone reductase [Propionicimonas paludicola]|uniref:NADPH2:quinone reductase n=1 Tax=Propionicimonas paludicola TaxID=185243 RepID=A0A2A9CRW9_9ACTN|nr:quinone oxidoreductase [Propionicimonas paludicola]PFG17174.1 NADPH2:quinone reductase [Propionicimonas paludicola]
MHAIQALQAGGPDVLELVEVPDPTPGPGEVVVNAVAAGVNFIDTYRRGGMYPMPFPHIPGSEGAGTVTAVGEGVTSLAVGDTVAWADSPGSYAEFVRTTAARALKVPAGVDLDVAAAIPLQGLTAHYLATSTYPVQAGDTILVHAGAGGVGLLLTQLATARGARVITTVSSDEKEQLSRAAGAAEVIRYDLLKDLPVELPALVREVAGGGLPVVYDGVGRSTFDASLACLRPRGLMVLFGASSGAVPPFDLQRLNASGSLYVTRPSLGHYIATTEELQSRADGLFTAILDHSLDVRIGNRFPLAEARAAHEALEGRATTGKVILQVR